MLHANDLWKRYGEVVALAGCSLSARRGRMLGLLGPNGAGKTTAMRAMFGLVSVDHGDVTWDGQPIDRRVRVRFGYMPEQRGLYPKMPVGDQLSHLAQLHGVERSEAGRAAAHWLDRLGLGDRAGDPLENLSHGNQQRVQLAAALVHGPELLVLDEPFSGLDPLGVDAMNELLREQAAAGVAIVFSSHQLDLVQSLCDDITVIAEGRDILDGTLDDLRSRSSHRRAEVLLAGEERWDPARTLPDAAVEISEEGRYVLFVPAGTEPEQVLDAARGVGEVLEFSFEPPRLSELFLEAVGR